jgi:hypothetical protein
MLTGAALATVNRIPVLLLPSDVFATRAAAPVLQELEDPRGYDVSVNDAFRPLSRFFDRVWRPEQLSSGACWARCGVLTDPVETGASPSACRRTCRPRRTTSRRRSSPGGFLWQVARARCRSRRGRGGPPRSSGSARPAS